ncbi:TrkA family potassium uptake protein [Gracilibacillus caseinilyticus]|uniref:TrkA family potassium uptake protein n=1 Tax=Gracilibacillus caseinilyticus TaxID=2932256 RepID=A0ABY4F0M0_9BACI|nr:TrkA family potassium uptake protein [Gracilibacillus caseinilyticus]UOQ50212.1 TrkA family potassium uptake protein [Gracilibacillus caseinilyticus]
MKKHYAVFGLGQFGGSLVKSFSSMNNVEVLAVDINPAKVDEYSKIATHSVRSNGIDENSLKEIGVRNVDHAFVSFGENIEASILTSLLLKEMGIPKVWAKAQNNYHHKVLSKIGVDRVMHPEREMARRIAQHVTNDNMIDFIELSKDHSIVEILAFDRLYNKSLTDLDIRDKYGCNIIGIQRNDETIISPSADETIYKNDVLIIIGRNKDIERFEKHRRQK